MQIALRKRHFYLVSFELFENGKVQVALQHRWG